MRPNTRAAALQALGLALGLTLSCHLAAAIPKAYRLIGEAHGVPAEVFFSVALQESGHGRAGKFLPWPWTLNIGGQGRYFETREAAAQALMQAVHQAGDARSAKVAVGLGQIYLPSHAHRFSHPLDALEPTLNLNYAAALLSSEYRWTARQGAPNWWVAVGRYHTPSRPDLARAYRAQVYARCQRFALDCARYGALEDK